MKKIFEKVKEWFFKIPNWFYKNLLFITLVVFALLVGLKLFYSSIIDWAACTLGLEFYQILVFVGAIAILFWANKRFKKVDKQLKQIKENAFLGTVNNAYLKVIELLSDKEERKTTKAKNLINYMQAFIDNYYKDISWEARGEKRKEVLNFFRMDLKEADLKGTDLRGVGLSFAKLQEADLRKANLETAHLQWADLTGANLKEGDLREADLLGTDLQKADLQKANLRGADLHGAKLFETNVKEADFKGAINIEITKHLHTTKHLDQAKGISEPLYSKVIEKWKTYWEGKGGHPKK